MTWTTPTATDNSEFTPYVTHSGKKPGERFAAGEHSIHYVASDKTGNVEECKFKVFVSGKTHESSLRRLRSKHYILKG